MDCELDIIQVQEVCNNKYIKRSNRPGKDVRGLTLRVVGYDSFRRKITFFTPVIEVETDYNDNSYKESILKNVGGFWELIDGRAKPKILQNMKIVVSFKRQEKYGDILVLKTTRLVNIVR